MFSEASQSVSLGKLYQKKVQRMDVMGTCNMEETFDGDSAAKRRDSERGYSLDDYIYEMQARAMKSDEPGEGSEADVYALLAQKEKDLILAAELGKALLEKNEELSRHNERQAEDYSKKLEILEQEKYILRRKLDNLETECDARVQELQADLTALRKELEIVQETSKLAEKEKAMLIAQLTEQNQRLTTEIKQSNKQEELLMAQLQSLRDQYNMKKSTVNDHVSQVELLRDEIQLLNERRSELERRINNMNRDRENLSLNLDESTDRIMLLEKETRDRESQIRHSEQEINDLRTANSVLVDRLETLSRHLSPAGSSHSSVTSPHGQLSLLNELEMSGDDRDSGRPFSHPSLHSDGALDDIDEDIEFDDPSHRPVSQEELRELRREIVEVYHMVKETIEDLKNRQKATLNSMDSTVTSASEANAACSSDEMTLSNIKLGVLRNALKELRALFYDLLATEGKLGSGAWNGREELEAQVHRSREACEQLQRQLTSAQDSLKHKNDEVADLNGKLQLCHVQIAALQEERDTLRQDLQNVHLSKDQIVKKAWEVRDQAVGRKNNAEIELARSRIEILHVNSQLMEAIQKKIELHQQLEQWQLDMEMLLDEQMRKKLEKEQRNRRRNQGRSSTSNTLQPGSPEHASGAQTPVSTLQATLRKTSRLLNLLKR